MLFLYHKEGNEMSHYTNSMARLDEEKDNFEEHKWQRKMQEAIKVNDLEKIDYLLKVADANDYNLEPFKDYLSILLKTHEV